MNRLANSLSPYLLQHADNPVHWQPWDEAALSQAQRADKPILLSVGYAACHWCHVMEEESFVDPDTAAMMNNNFICIKVDREERPDIDRIYQSAHYAFVRRPGGWPLTMFLTPGGEPFFGGTYFPREARAGMVSFRQILHQVTAAWRDKRDDIARQNEAILPLLRSLDEYESSDDAMSAEPIARAEESFAALFDPEHGGFHGAPKFPHPAELNFCLARTRRAADNPLRPSLLLTLQKMSDGGLQDHVGGGFFRYCVDAQWTIPHFEKMLYDNGLLLPLYADASIIFSRPDFAAAAAGIAEWALNEMLDSGGGFYSSLDADSDGGEGRFYVWERAEIEQALTAEEYAVFAPCFGVDAPANFEHHRHLTRRQSVVECAAALKLSPDKCGRRIESARQKLFRRRAGRARPATDDKILAAWNGLMIFGLARAGRLLQREDWIAAAHKALKFIREKMVVQGRLRAVWRRGQCGREAFLDDHAFLLAAALELLRADFSAPTLNFARHLAAQISERFAAPEGGFFFTADDGEKLIRRVKAMDDEAIPGGNGVAARALPLLSRLGGETQWADEAERALKVFYPALCRRPTGAGTMLLALDDYLHPPPTVFLRGDVGECKQWQRRLEQEHGSELPVFVLSPTLPPDLAATLPIPRESPPSGVRAYLCRDFVCRPPMDDWAQLQTALSD